MIYFYGSLFLTDWLIAHLPTYLPNGQHISQNIIEKPLQSEGRRHARDGCVRLQPVAGGPGRSHVRGHRRGKRGRARGRRHQAEPEGSALEPLYCING